MTIYNGNALCLSLFSLVKKNIFIHSFRGGLKLSAQYVLRHNSVSIMVDNE